MGDDRFRVRHAALSHSQWLEDASLQDSAEWAAVDPFDDHTQQEVARVAVVPSRARSEVHGTRMGDLDDLLRRHAETVDIVGCDFLVVGNARRMRQQMSHRHAEPLAGEIRQILMDGVIQPEFIFLDEQHDGGGNELLADGADLEHGAVHHRNR